MYIVCLDLESILMPEIWINIAKKTNIQELQLTTRDVPDYEALMNKRLKILKSHNIKLKEVQKIIQDIEPFEGAVSFLNWLREKMPIIILTDSFWEFVSPLIEKLSYPTILCNSLEIDEQGFIKNYKLRQKDGKQKTVKALNSLAFNTIAVGDSYNDISMLKEAKVGMLFNPSENIIKEFPQFLIARDYEELKSRLKKYITF